MLSELLVPRENFYHFGIIVRDFDQALDELGSTMGLEWASVQRRTFEVRQPNGILKADFRVTYSITGPPHFEIVECTPGTIWEPAGGGGVHHLGYWSADLAADSDRLTNAGYVWEATYNNPEVDGPFGFTYHTLPGTGIRIELSMQRANLPSIHGLRVAIFRRRSKKVEWPTERTAMGLRQI